MVCVLVIQLSDVDESQCLHHEISQNNISAAVREMLRGDSYHCRLAFNSSFSIFFRLHIYAVYLGLETSWPGSCYLVSGLNLGLGLWSQTKTTWSQSIFGILKAVFIYLALFYFNSV